MNSNQDTPINNTNTILEAIAGLRQEMNDRFSNVETRLRLVEEEIKETKKSVNSIDAHVAHIESEFFSFNVRLKRVEAMSHEALSIGKNLDADMMIVKAEVLAWSQDVMSLQRKVA